MIVGLLVPKDSQIIQFSNILTMSVILETCCAHLIRYLCLLLCDINIPCNQLVGFSTTMREGGGGPHFARSIFFFSYMNVREYRRRNQIWTIQRSWQYRLHKTQFFFYKKPQDNMRWTPQYANKPK